MRDYARVYDVAKKIGRKYLGYGSSSNGGSKTHGGHHGYNKVYKRKYRLNRYKRR